MLRWPRREVALFTQGIPWMGCCSAQSDWYLIPTRAALDFNLPRRLNPEAEFPGQSLADNWAQRVSGLWSNGTVGSMHIISLRRGKLGQIITITTWRTRKTIAQPSRNERIEPGPRDTQTDNLLHNFLNYEKCFLSPARANLVETI